MEKSCLLAPNDQIQVTSPYLRWPLYGSRKYDGNRLLIKEGQLLSRNLKLQPNVNLIPYLKDVIEYSKLHHVVFDGEFYSHEMTFPEMQTVIRSFAAGIPKSFKYYIFDRIELKEWGFRTKSYQWRFDAYQKDVQAIGNDKIIAVDQTYLQNSDDAQKMYEQSIEDGYEGLILRSPTAGYKYGRATVNEGIIYKLKEFVTVDGVIIGFQQAKRMKDSVRYGPREMNEIGHTKKSYQQDDYELANSLGSLLVRTEDGIECKIGFSKGFDHDERKKLWDKRNSLIGKHVEIKYMRIGMKDALRMGQLVRFRPDKD